jgi:TRAP-type C4-dicarboxylate transport system substrate-binding protein
MADFVTLLNGIPVSIAWAECYTSLQTGVVEGIITNSGSMYETKLFEVIKCLTTFEIGFGLRAFVVRKDAFDALPTDLKDKLLDWAVKTEQDLRLMDMAFYDSATLKGVAEYGITIKAPSPDFRKEVRDKCWEVLWKPWIEEGGESAEMAFNNVAKSLIAEGYTVPGYVPF